MTIIEINSNEHLQDHRHTHLVLVVSLKSLKVLLSGLEDLLDLFSFLCKHVTFTGGNIDLCLLGIDLSRPWLKFLLLDFDLVMEDLSLVCTERVNQSTVESTHVQIAYP